MATRSMALGLIDAGIQVDILAIETDRHPARADEAAELATVTDFQATHVDTEVTFARALRGLFSACYNVDRFDSKPFRAQVEHRLAQKNFDAIILDSLYAAPYLSTIRRMSEAPVVLRAHNVEHQVWDRLARNTDGIKGMYLSYIAWRLRRYEMQFVSKVDAIAAIAEPDRLFFEQMVDAAPAALVEVGLDAMLTTSQSDITKPLCSLAAYDWLPNVEAMRWFLDHVWPRVLEGHPSAKLDIAGRQSERFTQEFERPGVRVLGHVPSAEGFLLERGVVIVPTRSGSGVRVKMIEAMLLGKPIVATGVGAQGATEADLAEVQIADSPRAFADAVVQLLSDQAAADVLGAAARAGAQQRFSRHAATEQLVDLIDRLSPASAVPSNRYARKS